MFAHLLGTLRLWPRRRWPWFGVLVIAMGAAYVRLGVPEPAVLGWVATAFAAVAAALILASYTPLPGVGLRLDLGCGSCSLVPAAVVIASFVVRNDSPQDQGLAMVSAGLLLFGVVHRLGGLNLGGPSCAGSPNGERSATTARPRSLAEPGPGA